MTRWRLGGICLLLGLASCAAPERSNRYDEKACDPACEEGQLCRSGVCIDDPCPLSGMVYVDERSGPGTGTDPFCIARHEALINKAGRAAWGPGQPTNLVFPAEAQLACREVGAELCDSEQWMDACDGRTSQNAQGHPPDPGRCNLSGSLKDTGASPDCEGGYTALFDMIGNLSEWTLTTRDTIAVKPADGLLGGSYRGGTTNCGTSEHVENTITEPLDTAGFRCCVPCTRGLQDKDKITCKVERGWFQYPIWGTKSGDLDSVGPRMWGASPSDIWMVSGQSASGSVGRFDGKRWTRDENLDNFGGAPMAVWGTGPKAVWMIKGARLLRYDGTGWEDLKVQFPTNIQLKSLWGIDAQTIWIVGETNGGSEGHLFSYDGTKATPVDLTGKEIGGLLDVWADPVTGQAWCIGQGGTALRYDGGTWSQQTITSDSVTLSDLHGSGAKDVWAVGQVNGDGVIYRFDGSSWTYVIEAEPLLQGQELAGVWALSPTKVWAVGGVNVYYDTVKKGWVKSTLQGQGHGAVWLGATGDVWLGRFRLLD